MKLRLLPASCPFAVLAVLAAVLPAPATLAQPAATAPAATAAVSGRIQKLVTGQYLTNARVAVRGADRIVFTDESGIDRLTGLPAGAVVLEVFFTGLDPQQIPLQLAAGEGVTRDVGLTSVARYGRNAGAVKLDAFVVATSRDPEGEALATNEQRFASRRLALRSDDSSRRARQLHLIQSCEDLSEDGGTGIHFRPRMAGNPLFQTISATRPSVRYS